MEQGSEKYQPILIDDDDITEKQLRSSFAQKSYLYGLSKDQFMELVEAQNTACASCGDDATGAEQSLQVDHCHNTLEIRGLLCSGCNTAAGWLDDDPERAEKLAKYLRSNGTGIFATSKPRSIHD